jgi:plasmid maintenance system killer protein
VDVRFKTNRLRECYEDENEGTREWGAKIARQYISRVNLLDKVKNAQDLRPFKALHFHALEGAKSGQYAIRLDDAWRLVVSFDDKGMTIVRVEEVSKHYGD